MSSRRMMSKSVKLSELSDEEIREFMDSAETDSESDYDSDDDVNDPNYIPDEITPEIPEQITPEIPDEVTPISPEDERAISMYLKEISIGNVADFSLNISSLDAPPASSTFREGKFQLCYTVSTLYSKFHIVFFTVYVPVEQDDIEAVLSEEEVEPIPSTSIAVEPVPSTSRAVPSILNPSKRARSPLPSLEVTGPSITPSDGGFSGQSKNWFFKFI